MLVNGVPVLGATDKVLWISNQKVGYLVKSGTSIIEKGMVDFVVDSNVQKAYSNLWLTNSPFRVLTFIWRCFINRISTKDKLDSNVQNTFFILLMISRAFSVFKQTKV